MLSLNPRPRVPPEVVVSSSPSAGPGNITPRQRQPSPAQPRPEPRPPASGRPAFSVKSGPQSGDIVTELRMEVGQGAGQGAGQQPGVRTVSAGVSGTQIPLGRGSTLISRDGAGAGQGAGQGGTVPRSLAPPTQQLSSRPSDLVVRPTKDTALTHDAGSIAPEALVEDVIVKEAYKETNSIVIRWESETTNILGFRVIYRLFGTPQFKQGPPLAPSEREFKIKNVPDNVSIRYYCEPRVTCHVCLYRSV